MSDSVHEPAQPPTIHQIMPLVMRDLGAIPKSNRNREQNYRFRGVDDVLNAVHPILCKHGISLAVRARNLKTETRVEPKAGGRGERTVYRSTLDMDVAMFAPDGSSVVHTTCGEGLDYGGDKATNKAMSAAFKYAICLGLVAPVEAGDIEDSDRDTADSAADEKPQSRVLDTAPRPGEDARSSIGLGEPCSESQRQRIIHSTQELGKDAAWLKDLLAKKGKQSLADLTVEQAEGLMAWLEQSKTEQQAAQHF